MFKTSVKLEDWDKTRDRLINRAVIAIGLIGVFGCFASLARTPVTGFQPTMLVHLGCALIVSVMALLRHRLSLNFKANTLLLMLVGIGLTGIVNWGLVGNSLLWLSMGGMLVTLTYGTLWGIVYAVVTMLVTVAMAWLFLSGQIILPINITSYVESSASWAASLADIGIMMTVLVLLIGGVHDSARSLIERLAEKNAEIAALADTDSLTGLANVRVAHDRLIHAVQVAQRHKEKIAVLFLDLDNFKQINDQLGHAAGDAVLQEIARRLLLSIRKADTVARIGGDEFLIIQEVRVSDRHIESCVKRLQQQIAAPIQFEDKTLSVTVSVGMIIAEPTDSETDIDHFAKQLINKADASMYVEKNRSRQPTAAS